MEGFNILSGSHVDKYVIDYSTFTKVILDLSNVIPEISWYI